MSNPLEALNDYELRNLPAHLVAGELSAELHALLRLEWSQTVSAVQQHYNAWYEATELHGLTSSFGEALSIASDSAAEAAKTQIAQGKLAADAGYQIRYALMGASFGERAQRLPASLCAALVKHGIWTPQQGLTYARGAPDPKNRAELLVALAGVLSNLWQEEAADEALAAVGDLRDIYGRLDQGAQIELEHLTPLLSAAACSRFLSDQDTEQLKDSNILPLFAKQLAQHGEGGAAASILARTDDEYQRMRVIRAVAEYVDDETWTQLAAEADGLSERWRQLAYAALHARATAFRDPDAALAAIDELPDDVRVDALVQSTASVPQSHISSVLERAHELRSPTDAARVLVPLAEAAEPPLRQTILNSLPQYLSQSFSLPEDELIRVAPLMSERDLHGALRGYGHSIRVKLAFARYLPEPARSEIAEAAINEALKEKDPATRLGKLIPAGWGEFQPAEALAAAAEAPNRRRVLEDLAPQLPPAMLRQALTMALTVQDEKTERVINRGTAPGWAVAVLLGELGRLDAAQALIRTRQIHREAFSSHAIAAMSPHLDENQAADALNVALELRLASTRMHAIAALSSRLAAEQRKTAFAACTTEDEGAWTNAVRAFAPYLSPSEAESAYRRSRHIDVGDRRRVLASLIPYLSTARKRKVGRIADREIRNLARQRIDEFGPVGLADLIGAVVANEGLAGLDRIRAIHQPRVRAEVIAEAATLLPADALEEALQLALSLAPDVGAHALVAVMERHPPARISELFEQAFPSSTGWTLARGLSAFAGRLPADQLIRLLPAAESQPTEDSLAYMLPHLPAGVFRAWASESASKLKQPHALAALAARSDGSEQRYLLRRAIDAADLDVSYDPIGYRAGYNPDRRWKPILDVVLTLPPATAYELIIPYLLAFVNDRTKLFAASRSLAPAIAHFGGVPALVEIIEAISDVYRWWL